MKDTRKTKDLLIHELNEARQLISDLQDSQSRLENDVEILEGLLSATPAGIALVRDRKFIKVNPATCRMLGYTEEEMLEMGTGSVYPDEEEYNRAGREMYVETERRGLSVRDVREKRRDGAAIRVNLSMSPLDPHDMSKGVCITTVDIGEQKRTEKDLSESEEKYRLLVENAGDAICVAQDGRLKFANRRAEELLGYSGEEIVALPFINFIYPDDRAMVMDYHLKRIRGEAAPDVYAFRVMDKDGNTRWAEIQVVLISWEGRPATLNLITDITERKRVEHMQRESEERMRGITNNLPGLVFQFVAKDNGEWLITYHSERVQEIFGLANEEMTDLFQTFLTYTHKDDLENLVASIWKAAETCSPWNHECRIITPQGKLLWMHGMSTPTRQEDGVVFNGIMLDITERKLAEDAIRKSEEMYRAIFEGTATANIIVALDTTIVMANDNFARLVGYSKQELEGRMSWTQFVVREDLERVRKNQMMRSVDPASVPSSYELRAMNREGEIRDLFMSVAVIPGTKESVASLIDITDWKRSERAKSESEVRFQELARLLPEVAYEADTRGVFTFVNQAWFEKFGYDDEDFSRGVTVYDVIVQEDHPRVIAAFKKLMRGELLGFEEYTARSKNGRTFPILVYATAMYQDGKTVGHRGFTVDVTERRKLEEQLMMAQKMESIGRLAGGVAHDFNNMLSVIIGNAEMAIAKLDESDPLHRTLRDILNAGNRSADLTRQLLAFARRQTIAPRVMDLNDTVTGMLKMLQRLIGENIDLSWNPSRRPWKIRIDPSQVDQLLANLTVNARDSIDKSGRIIIETSNELCDVEFCVDKPECVPGEYVMLAVSDNGCGMDRQTQANIFEPFFTTKKEGQGTGLGLATVYGIVKQNGGFINVYSEPGKGTTFRIYIPRHKAEGMESAEEAEETKVLGGTETVMIVEDEEAVLHLATSMLEQLGYHVLAAGNADQAMEIAKGYGEQIHLLLTDVIMPDLDGKELLERIRSIKPDLRCLFMSGYTADVITRKGILEEGVHFIPKPFSLRGLAVKIREAIG